MLFPYNRGNGFRMVMANGMLPKDGSNEKVAYDLMQIIAGQEANKTADKRKYYLELYAQCLRIVSGEDFDDVFDDDE
ncbi:MAG TPA: hypothetical protein VK810_01660 [Dongiaceae bacterium]|jgi:hypothetical protein|nr:hypothetical protein [Dongiaceae bacterium]